MPDLDLLQLPLRGHKQVYEPIYDDLPIVNVLFELSNGIHAKALANLRSASSIEWTAIWRRRACLL